MEEEYLIEEVFLETDAPDSAEIEIEESGFVNFIIQSENTNIEAEMIVSGIGKDKAEEPSIEEYMRISDYINNPNTVVEENYTKEEVLKCETLINFYKEMEG